MFAANLSSRFRNENIRFIVGGIGFLLFLTVLTAVTFALVAIWYEELSSRQDSRDASTKLSAFLLALEQETSARLDGASAAAIQGAQAAVDAESGFFAGSVASAMALYRATANTDGDTLMSYHVDIINAATSQAYTAVNAIFSERLQSSLQVILQTQASALAQAVTDVVAAFNHVGAASSATLMQHLAVSYAQLESVSGLLGANSGELFVGNTKAMAEMIIDNAAARMVVTASTQLITGGADLNATISATAGVAANDVEFPSEYSVAMITFGTLTAVCLIATVLVAVVVMNYIRSTRRSRLLLRSFGNPEDTRKIIKTYRPVIELLQVDPLNAPQLRELEDVNEVSRAFSTAASATARLRCLLPQALFGELHAEHKRQPDGSWQLLAQPVRLEMGMTFCRCSVMTININFARADQFEVTKEGANQMIRDMNSALTLITTEVNAAGGIVYSVSPGGVVTCVWNATNVVEGPAVHALPAAHRVDAMFRNENLDVNITTGNCAVSNTKIGEKKHAMMVGAPFDMAERLLVLNEGHDARLVIDYETFKDLPRELHRQCKPVAILKINDDDVVVVYTADGQKELPDEQWHAYNSAFTLYQNNMISEAHSHYERYLHDYPNDMCAQWLLDNVLQPRRRGSRSKSKHTIAGE